MANTTFETGEQRELANRIVTSTKEYLARLDDIKGAMVQMGNFWIDPQYDEFMAVFGEEYRRLSSLQDDLANQSNDVFRAADDGDALIAKAQNIING